MPAKRGEEDDLHPPRRLHPISGALPERRLGRLPFALRNAPRRPERGETTKLRRQPLEGQELRRLRLLRRALRRPERGETIRPQRRPSESRRPERLRREKRLRRRLPQGSAKPIRSWRPALSDRARFTKPRRPPRRRPLSRIQSWELRMVCELRPIHSRTDPLHPRLGFPIR